MFGLIRKLMQLLRSVDIDSLGTIMEIIQALIGIGLPPDVKNENDFRIWVDKLADTLQVLTGKSATKFDDMIANLLVKVVDSDELWSLFYGLLVSIFDDDNNDDLSFTMGQTDAANLLSEKVGISPAMILMIIKMIVVALQKLI